MQFSLLISSGPDVAATQCAIKFCDATLRQGHNLHRAFFLADGVLNSASNAKLISDWERLIQNHHLDAVCCINSAHKFGLVDQYGNSQCEHSLFHFSGLGQLIDASLKSERLITFGQR